MFVTAVKWITPQTSRRRTIQLLNYGTKSAPAAWTEARSSGKGGSNLLSQLAPLESSCCWYDDDGSKVGYVNLGEEGRRGNVQGGSDDKRHLTSSEEEAPSHGYSHLRIKAHLQMMSVLRWEGGDCIVGKKSNVE